MHDLKLRGANGRVLNAKVEIDDGRIVLHSRSGAGARARNPDYRPALEVILTNLGKVGIKPDVYLDSRPAQSRSLVERRIAKSAELTGEVPDQFDHLVRAMNKGSRSHGAWRRIMLAVPGQSKVEIARLLNATSEADQGSNPIQTSKPTQAVRLSAEEQRRVRPEHVVMAVERLLSGEDLPQFADSRDYDLVTPQGDRLAPKKVFGLALELAGVVPNSSPAHFSAGWSQPSFELLEAAGFTISPKADAAVDTSSADDVSEAPWTVDAAEQADAEAESTLQGRTDIGPTQISQLVSARRGQGIFRANVRLNETECRITGVSDPRFLIASHIKPWRLSNDQEKLDGCNGLLLSPHVDRLFDKGFISFADDGSVLLSEQLPEPVWRAWFGDAPLPAKPFNERQRAYMAYHRSEILK